MIDYALENFYLLIGIAFLVMIFVNPYMSDRSKVKVFIVTTLLLLFLLRPPWFSEIINTIIFYIRSLLKI